MYSTASTRLAPFQLSRPPTTTPSSPPTLFPPPCLLGLPANKKRITSRPSQVRLAAVSVSSRSSRCRWRSAFTGGDYTRNAGTGDVYDAAQIPTSTASLSIPMAPRIVRLCRVPRRSSPDTSLARLSPPRHHHILPQQTRRWHYYLPRLLYPGVLPSIFHQERTGRTPTDHHQVRRLFLKMAWTIFSRLPHSLPRYPRQYPRSLRGTHP